MSTAIIVSGSIRNIINAANSWKFKGDYHLIIDRFSHFPQSNDILSDNVQELKSIVDDSLIKFTSVNICLDNKLEGEVVKTHSSINMAWKWKCAYHNLLPYHNYSKVLLLRPDLYIHSYKDELDSFKINDNNIYSHSKLYLNKDDPTNPSALRSTDLFLYMSINTFKKLSGFYNYYLKQPHSEVHSLLAKFIIENGIEINDDMKNLCNIVVLRDSSKHMFENGLLKEEYSFTDIVNDGHQWWTEKYK